VQYVRKIIENFHIIQNYAWIYQKKILLLKFFLNAKCKNAEKGCSFKKVMRLQISKTFKINGRKINIKN